jgi:hypothetical protein
VSTLARTPEKNPMAILKTIGRNLRNELRRGNSIKSNLDNCIRISSLWHRHP